MEPQILSLFKDVSKLEWLTKIQKDLKGKAIEDLELEISEYIKISPFLHREDVDNTLLSYRKKKNNSWNITELMSVSNCELSNKQALKFLSLGVNALVFSLKAETSLEDIEKLLKDIRLDFITVHFILHDIDQLSFVNNYISFLESSQYDLTTLQGSVRSTQFHKEKSYKSIQLLSARLPKNRSLYIKEVNDGALKPDESLADVLHTCYNQLDVLLEMGLSVKEITNQFIFCIEGGLSYFTEIAKIRALRILVDLLFSAYSQEVLTSTYIEYRSANYAAHDHPDYNKIQVTTQTMAAIIGGANDIYVSGINFADDAEKLLEDRRIYNNIQHILQMESYLDRVVDPAAGSYYIEQLTDKIAASAWDLFKKKVKV